MKQNYREWVEGLYREHGLDQDANLEVYKYYDEGLKLGIIPEGTEKEHFKRQCRRVRLFLVKNDFHEEKDDHDILDYNVKLMKKNQRTQDLMRVERKVFRENARVENALVEISKALIEVVERVDLSSFTREHKEVDREYVMVASGSDLHLNELVRPTTSLRNSFDFTIAAKRLKKYATHLKKLAKLYNITEIALCLTGDLINSDRRKDEIMSAATNRASAVMLACYLLEQFIIDLNSVCNIRVASVLGNESRIGDELTYSEVVASDNWDVVIDKILRIMFRNAKGVTFANGSYNEKVIGMQGFNLLMLHGHTLNGPIDKAIYSKMAKYAQSGIIIDYTIFGHIHQAYVSDWYSRSSSLVGGNAYSDEGLNLLSKASQNCLIICPATKDVHAVKIDLQDVEWVHGYDIIKEIEEYNAKSATKLHNDKVIVQVVI